MLSYFLATIIHLPSPPFVPSLYKIRVLRSMVLNGFLVDALLGPVHMCPVNGAGSVSKISPRHSLYCKKFDEFISIVGVVFANEISVTGLNIFPCERSSR